MHGRRAVSKDPYSCGLPPPPGCCSLPRLSLPAERNAIPHGDDAEADPLVLQHMRVELPQRMRVLVAHLCVRAALSTGQLTLAKHKCRAVIPELHLLIAEMTQHP